MEGKLKEGRETNLWGKSGEGTGQYYIRNGLAVLAFKVAIRIELANMQKLREASWRDLNWSSVRGRAVLQPGA